jgi:hypothetical protein
MNEPEEKIEIDLDASEELELEIVDDTPEEDKGKARRSKDAEAQIPEDDEVANYSDNVQKRFKQMKWEYHEERRAKEEAARLREEAVKYAQSVYAENQKLRQTLSQGENVLQDQAKRRVEAEIERAKYNYKNAYESGDPDEIIKAQEALTIAQTDKMRLESYVPVHQYEEQQVQSNYTPPQPAAPKVKKPDAAALDWQSQNEWFGNDDEMTGYALGLHESLVKSGVNPNSPEYYDRIDESVRKRFSDKFDGQDIEVARSRQTGSVVAPAKRSAKKPRRVQLTSTQVALAKRLGLSPEQYAAQLLKEAS